MREILTVILALYFSSALSIEIQRAFPLIPISSANKQLGLCAVSDPFGNMVAVWMENNIILTSDLPLNGNWSAPVSLSSPIATASAPKLEIDSSGTAMVIWFENNRFKASSRPVGGNWTLYTITPDSLSRHEFEANDHPNIDCSKGSHSRTKFLRDKRWMDLVTSGYKGRKLMSANAIDAPSGGALSGAQIGFTAGTAAPSGGMTVSSSLVMNGAALATNATDGFIYESGCAGTPTGVPTAQTGRAAIVVDTTNNIPYFYNGTSPSAVPGGWVPANGMVLISKQVLVGAAASVTFSNIPQVYNHLRLIANVRFSGAATNLLMGIRFNGDSGNNYDRQQYNFVGTGSNASGANAVSSIWAGFCPAATNPANAFGETTTDIAFYTSNNFFKLSQTQSVQANTSINQIASTGGAWRNTTAITSMTLIDASTGTNFTIGSSFTLYGIN